MSKQYPNFSIFLLSWFHQDFDVCGETLEQVASAYKESAPSLEVDAIRADIKAFLASNNVDKFDEIFDTDVDPLAFADSIGEFLLAIDRALVAG